jgi:hypothetical protein
VPPGRSTVKKSQARIAPAWQRRNCDQSGQVAVDAAVSPSRVLPGQPEDQGLDVLAGRRAAGLALLGSGRLAADAVAVPAQDRVQCDQQSQLLASCSGYHAEQSGEQGLVRPGQCGRRGCRRCRTASWWRRSRISAVCRAFSRWDSRSRVVIRMMRRNANCRHMTSAHRGRASASNSAGQSRGSDSRHAQFTSARSGSCWRSQRGSFRACSGSWPPWDRASRMTQGECLPWPAKIAGWRGM